MTTKHHFIVVGNPINHSKSPQIHTTFAHSLGINISYIRQFCPDNFESFKAVVEAFFAGGGQGANVTLPFKEMAYQLCGDHLSDHAKSAKAVNTLLIKNDKIYGDNTDGIGLVSDLKRKNITLNHKKIALLGAGGASRGVILPLQSAGADVHLFNRTLAKAQTMADEFGISAQSLDNLNGHFDIIINATSATTHGQHLTLSHLTADVAYDMMYGKPSPFLAYFKAYNAQCFDGLGMLIEQARASFEKWTGQKIDLNKVNIKWD